MIMDKYKQWAQRKSSSRQQLITLLVAGLFFLLLFPFLLVTCSTWIDRSLGLPGFSAGIANDIAGALLVAAGAALGWWSIERQLSIGEGTPVPLVPTRKLIRTGPFAWCRNPMTLGTFIAYLGIGVLAGSISALVIVTLFTAILIMYIRFVEEKELEARFGKDYVAYKKSTPFIIPRLRRRSRRK